MCIVDLSSLPYQYGHECMSVNAVMSCYCAGVIQGFDEPEVSFAKAAFSNLVGGISYFYGKSKQVI